MEKSGFFNANLVGEAYDREYLAQDFAEYFSSFIGNGVFPNPSTGLQVLAQGGRDIAISVGEAWINGYWYSNTSQKQFVIDPADGVLNRIDTIIIQLNYSDRSVVSKVIKGQPVNVPNRYVPLRNSDVYELVVAYVAVNKGTVSILQADITDTRLDTQLCGIVHGIVDQIDTQTLYLQIQSALSAFKNVTQAEYNTWTTNKQAQYSAFVQNMENLFGGLYSQQEKDFIAWFQTIQGILIGDIAGELALRLLALESLIDGGSWDNPIPEKLPQSMQGYLVYMHNTDALAHRNLQIQGRII